MGTPSPNISGPPSYLTLRKPVFKAADLPEILQLLKDKGLSPAGFWVCFLDRWFVGWLGWPVQTALDFEQVVDDGSKTKSCGVLRGEWKNGKFIIAG